ncbi:MULTISPECIES: helix-turn-helix domain-containing protein [Frankia]|uniref:HTH-type transcriptional regulator n=1 Tax=Frankia alni (strain DSM 45986 / CECT 9034 / ACN14a) TaxID=326424 RepID=Q0RUC3_FRAAA|nr:MULTISPECIES: helix-turn-helix transcriptional regulator [Frankia]CAJ58819.1 Putative HTH-type transcriptional regulator [Frankia alni ACN14a]
MPGRTREEDRPNVDAGRRLGAHIRTRREELNLSRAALAEAAGISPVTLARIEQQRTVNPRLFTVAALAATFDTTLDDLLAAAMAPRAGQFVSVGYEGRTLDAFVSYLLDWRVGHRRGHPPQRRQPSPWLQQDPPTRCPP